MSSSPPSRLPLADRAQNASSPVLGTATWLVLLVVLILQVGLPHLEAPGDARHAVWLGCMWGGLAVATWLLAGGRQSLWSWGILLAVTAWHISWMHHVSVRPLSRYVLSMGGMVIVQSVSMLLAGSPTWRWPGGGKLDQTSQRPAQLNTAQLSTAQFNIAGLLMLTLACAISFAAARRYETDDQLFYSGLALAVVTLVSTTLFAQRLACGPRRSWWWAAGLLGSAVGGSYALSALATINDQLRGLPASVQYIEHTELILAINAAVVWAAGRSGVKERAVGQ